MRVLAKKPLVQAVFFLGLVLPIIFPSCLWAAPLRVHPQNPRYFINDAGGVVYLTGSHAWYNIHSAEDRGITIDDVDDEDFENFLDWEQGHDQNFTRLWTGWSYLGRPPYPWHRPGPGTANDGLSKFDMTSFNQEYFEMLKRRLGEMQSRGMSASIMFFGSHNRFKSDFDQVAWHEDNNINSALASAFNDDGYSFFTTNSAALEIQKGQIRKFIDELNGFDNIIWEIMNESGGTSEAVSWHKAMVEYAQEYEQQYYPGREHPVGMTGGWGLGNEMRFSSANWISPDTKTSGDYKNGGPASYDEKVVINDTDHLWGGQGIDVWISQTRKWVWKTFARGNHPILMDPYNVLIPERGFEGKINHRLDPSRNNLGYTLGFAQRMNLAEARPSGSSSDCSTTYCLIDSGVEYLVYLPSRGSFSLNLLAGRYHYEWFHPDYEWTDKNNPPNDPLWGGIVKSGTITVNDGSRSFSTSEIPSSLTDDAVLHLRSLPFHFRKLLSGWLGQLEDQDNNNKTNAMDFGMGVL